MCSWCPKTFFLWQPNTLAYLRTTAQQWYQKVVYLWHLLSISEIFFSQFKHSSLFLCISRFKKEYIFNLKNCFSTVKHSSLFSCSSTNNKVIYLWHLLSMSENFFSLAKHASLFPHNRTTVVPKVVYLWHVLLITENFFLKSNTLAFFPASIVSKSNLSLTNAVNVRKLFFYGLARIDWTRLKRPAGHRHCVFTCIGNLRIRSNISLLGTNTQLTCGQRY